MGSPPSGPETRLRTVRSFVTRAGRLTAAQQRALTEQWPRYGVDFSAARLDLAALFGNARPCTMEIGFGNGEHLAARAQAEPERNFLGVEVYRPGIGALLRVVGAAELSNVRVIAHDAVDVLRERIAADALDEVELLFPDPWPKKRHHKRRLIQAEFVQLVATRLSGGGRFRLATDWEPYAEQMRLLLDACPLLEREDAASAGSRAPTRFERRGTALGLKVHDLLYLRARALSQRISAPGP
jgi:tRNA (guanine-N7-)-methyltransferase